MTGRPSGRARRGMAWRLRIFATVATVALASSLLASAPIAAQSTPATAELAGDSESLRIAFDDRPKETAETISDHVVSELAVTSELAPAWVTTAVEIHGSDLDLIDTAVADFGGEVTGRVPGFFVEARVPIDEISALADHPDIQRITRVTELDSGLQTQRTDPTALAASIEDTVGLDAWHEAEQRGAGQRIGIVDIFDTGELEQAISQGRLPAPTGVFCRRGGAPCAITQQNVGPHGVGVAEIAHTAAPDAEIYLATALTLSDLSAAIDWFTSQGVTIVNRSQTSEFDGPGDGTGPMTALIDRAVDNGMVWVSAAGNAGGFGPSPGQNWVGGFNDPDGNGVHNWESGRERMAFTCGFLLGMRWDDWADDIVPTDYDLLIYDNLNDIRPEAVADDLQSTLAHRPLERTQPFCSGPNDIDYLSIVLYNDEEPDGVDQIQILGNFTSMEEWVNEFSATGPGVDSANPGAISVGATTSPSNDLLAIYSSQGPTFDGRTSVEVAAPACLPVEGFGDCFIGTSASAPLVAGVLAVLRSANVFTEATDARRAIGLVTTDAGPTGPDSLYGQGVLNVGTPTALGVDVPLVRFCQGERATVVGTSGDDVLQGTPERDVFFGGLGNDRIIALGGDDLICGGGGDDDINAGNGNDIVIAGNGDDIVRGRRGNDQINGGDGDDDINGNADNDVVLGSEGSDLLRGGLGDDILRGGDGPDELLGGSGNDQVFGDRGVDSCPVPHEFVESCRS